MLPLFLCVYTLLYRQIRIGQITLFNVYYMVDCKQLIEGINQMEHDEMVEIVEHGGFMVLGTVMEVEEITMRHLVMVDDILNTLGLIDEADAVTNRVREIINNG